MAKTLRVVVPPHPLIAHWLTVLRHVALTSAERYARDGFALRSLRNFACLTLYYLRVPPRVLSRIYNA